MPPSQHPNSKMTSTDPASSSASASSLPEHDDIDQANERALKIAGPLKITGTKLAHEIEPEDFVILGNQQCRIKSTRFLSPIKKLQLCGRPIFPIPCSRGRRYREIIYELMADAMEELQIPEIKVMLAGEMLKYEYRDIGGRPCYIVDRSDSRSGFGSEFHFIGKDVFTGEKKEDLVSSRLLLSRLEVQWEQKRLLSISEDYLCSLVGGNNTIEDNIEVPNQVLGKAIKSLWAEGRRKITVRIAHSMGLRGVAGAWEVRYMKLLGTKGREMSELEHLGTGARLEILHPTGKKGEDMRRLLREVKSGRKVVMEILFPLSDFSPEWTLGAISVGKEVMEEFLLEDALSDWTLIGRGDCS